MFCLTHSRCIKLAVVWKQLIEIDKNLIEKNVVYFLFLKIREHFAKGLVFNRVRVFLVNPCPVQRKLLFTQRLTTYSIQRQLTCEHGNKDYHDYHDNHHPNSAEYSH
ncbi:hypothetical protein BpHYR1_007279 [Brachionus plicatilis]|uniref:Uncharacterized protein n=1 Tax=Brachionus plicatilis TaxID=10195 RepID=A0A3M7Q3D7_BRAPC|nr:hypothetical protein BpHYR1_007279 [Brachionus plicatilis]